MFQTEPRILSRLIKIITGFQWSHLNRVLMMFFWQSISSISDAASISTSLDEFNFTPLTLGAQHFKMNKAACRTIFASTMALTEIAYTLSRLTAWLSAPCYWGVFILNTSSTQVEHDLANKSSRRTLIPSSLQKSWNSKSKIFLIPLNGGIWMYVLNVYDKFIHWWTTKIHSWILQFSLWVTIKTGAAVA